MLKNEGELNDYNKRKSYSISWWTIPGFFITPYGIKICKYIQTGYIYLNDIPDAKPYLVLYLYRTNNNIYPNDGLEMESSQKFRSIKLASLLVFFNRKQYIFNKSLFYKYTIHMKLMMYKFIKI